MRYLLVIFLIVLVGCGYTTRGFVYQEDRIYIRPVINKISITQEDRVYSSYTSYPILLEKRLTNVLVNKFNIDGHLKVAGEDLDALILECEVRDYKKEALRYADNDAVTEQRLRLTVHMILRDKDNNIIKEREIIGETSYFLSGSLMKSEASAQADLVDDTARRILEAVVEDW